MTNQPKQIIPDLQAVAHFLDETFLISDLLENFKPPVDDQESFINRKCPIVYRRSRVSVAGVKSLSTVGISDGCSIPRRAA
jgi:hypothetical protein